MPYIQDPTGELLGLFMRSYLFAQNITPQHVEQNPQGVFETHQADHVAIADYPVCLDGSPMPKHLRKAAPYIFESFEVNNQMSSPNSRNKTKPFEDDNQGKAYYKKPCG